MKVTHKSQGRIRETIKRRTEMESVFTLVFVIILKEKKKGKCVSGRFFGKSAKCPTSFLILVSLLKKDMRGQWRGRTLPTLETWTNHHRLGGALMRHPPNNLLLYFWTNLTRTRFRKEIISGVP